MDISTERQIKIEALNAEINDIYATAAYEEYQRGTNLGDYLFLTFHHIVKTGILPEEQAEKLIAKIPLSEEQREKIEHLQAQIEEMIGAGDNYLRYLLRKIGAL